MSSWYDTFTLNSTEFSNDKCLLKSCIFFIRVWSSSPRHEPIMTSFSWKKKVDDPKFRHTSIQFTLFQSVSSSINSERSSYIACNCNGWSFSGRNCPIDRMIIFSLSKCSNFFKWLVSHGGYTRCVRNGISHNWMICFSVHEEFTMTVNALRPTQLYNLIGRARISLLCYDLEYLSYVLLFTLANNR